MPYSNILGVIYLSSLPPLPIKAPHFSYSILKAPMSCHYPL